MVDNYAFNPSIIVLETMVMWFEEAREKLKKESSDMGAGRNEILPAAEFIAREAEKKRQRDAVKVDVETKVASRKAKEEIASVTKDAEEATKLATLRLETKNTAARVKKANDLEIEAENDYNAATIELAETERKLADMRLQAFEAKQKAAKTKADDVKCQNLYQSAKTDYAAVEQICVSKEEEVSKYTSLMDEKRIKQNQTMKMLEKSIDVAAASEKERRKIEKVLERLSRTLPDALREKNAAAEKKDSLFRAMSAKEKELSEAENVYSELRIELETKNAMKAQADTEKAAVMEAYNDRVSEAELLQNAYELSQSELALLDEAIDIQQKEIARIDEIGARGNDILKRAELQEKVNTALQNRTLLQEKIDRLPMEIVEANRLIELANVERTRVNESYGNVAGLINRAQAEFSHAEDNLRYAKSDLKQIASRYMEAEEIAKKKEDAYEKLYQDSERAKKDLMDRENHCDYCNRLIDTAKDQVELLGEQYADAQTQVERAKLELAEASKKLATKEAALEEAKAAVKQSENERLDAENSLSYVEGELARLEEACEACANCAQTKELMVKEVHKVATQIRLEAPIGEKRIPYAWRKRISAGGAEVYEQYYEERVVALGLV